MTNQTISEQISKLSVTGKFYDRFLKSILLVPTLFVVNYALAQTTGSMVEQTGTIPSGYTNTKSLTPNALGVGKLLSPDGWQEIRWCQPDQGPEQRGLIITREFCNPVNPLWQNARNYNDFIFTDLPISEAGGTGGTSAPEFSSVPVPTIWGPLPFNLYSPYNGGSNHNPSPLIPLRSGQQPIFQARTVDYPNATPNSGSVKSRFIVMPDGNCGINNEDPRAALDVLDANSPNMPVAIFGNVLAYNKTNLTSKIVNSTPVNQTYSRHIAIVPRLTSRGFNMISRDEDMGLFLRMV